MKKIFIFAAILGGVMVVMAGAGLAVFILTFDADQYRPMVVRKIEETIGKPVDLKFLSLTWRNGLALRLDQLAIYGDESKQGQPVIRFDEASAHLQLLPLLRRQVEFDSIRLDHPYVHLIRQPDGDVVIAGLDEISPKPDAQQIPAKQPSLAAAGAVSAVLPLWINALNVEGGKILLSDRMRQFASDVEINDFDIALKDVSFTRPIVIDAKAAAFSEKQNLSFTGRLRYDLQHQAADLNEARLESDLGLLDVPKIFQALPSLRELGIEQKLAGDLSIDFQSLRFDSEGLKEFAAQARLQNGRVVFKQIASPIENIALQMDITLQRVQLKHFSADCAGGTVTALGAVEHVETHPDIAFELAAQQLKLDALSPQAEAEEPQLRGIFSGSFQGTARGKDALQISQTLAGQGRVGITQGVLVNVNILQEVFRNLSSIPGLVEKLRARLPESYQAKFDAKDTMLQPIDLPFVVNQGTVFIDRLQIATDSFQVTGVARIGLQGTVDSQMMLVMDPDLSDAFIRSVNELEYLANPQGQLQIPVRVTGTLSKPRVLPDITYVASKLAVSKTQEVLAKLLEKKLKKEGEQQTPPPSEPPKIPKTRTLLGQLLESALEGTPQGTPEDSKTTT